MKKLLSLLDYSFVIDELQQKVATPMVEEHIHQITPSFVKEEVQQALEQTKEAMTMLRLGKELPFLALTDPRQSLSRIKIGASIQALEILNLGHILKNAAQVLRKLEELEEEESFPELKALIQQLQPIPSLSGEIHRCINEQGQVEDSATERLAQLRRQIRQCEQQIRGQLSEMIRGKNSRYLSDAVITMRSDRYVIPVKAEYRNQFGGMVHDQSATGQTLFIEPKAIVELNNRRQQMKVEEKEEVQRILAQLIQEIMPHRQEIQQNAYHLGQLDVIQAKAKLAAEMKACIPEMSTTQSFSFLQARHPLLNPETVVPNDIYLGEEFQSLLITGPNTGGKTITLKTVGLLQLMLQTGMAIPVAEESTMTIFDQIMVDIGDEQSIEQSLSTFSGHMKNIIQILDRVGRHSLVLLDELGAGTDPQEGAALAIAILNRLLQKGALTLCTTHYPELKVYAYNEPHTCNASMEFDVQTLSPTYRLLIGAPGSSNAFEISLRLGLDPTLITEAKENMDHQTGDLANMIEQLENARQGYEEKEHAFTEKLSETEALQKELKEAFAAFKKEKAHLLKEAKKEANQVVEKASVEAKEIIQDLKEKQEHLDTKAVKEHELIAAQTQLNHLKSEEEQHLLKNKVLQREKKKQALAVGDEVLVESYGQRGTLVRPFKDGTWEVQLGILKMKLPESEFTRTKKAQEQQKETTMTTIQRSNSKGVKASLDLRGERYEEAMQKVEQYLDQALVAGYHSVTLVHGKGTGALRQGIQKLLQRHRHIDHFEYAPANAGGNGATIVYFKGA
ncbi:endonuclease MutS2 [Catellicoccus marimammalium]|uniref:Endonuclease MutS2 n=1 Tax=Catellicoccus marimammalium M35/04/3 TaxID=1234409 RepID=K8ZMV2_9ENTE|nr:endonuclease MutS2 [Catellicoccus marimammalium]EKU27878.1 Recombination inhibitory protein MutS2 [Catellicoccus marimammalium M35/04/3]